MEATTDKAVLVVPTTPYQDQKAGTSGLRKKVKVFKQPHYLENFVQSIFLSLSEQDYKGRTLVIAGDGRYHNDVAIQTIINMAAANGVRELVVGVDGLISTPAASAIIRKLNAADPDLCVGGILLTASHNPGGEHEDFGIKFNSKNGGPALESLTNKIFDHSKAIASYKTLKDPVAVDVSKPGVHALGSVEGQPITVRVIDSTEDYVELMQGLFDFPKLKAFVQRPDFTLLFDGMHGASGPYARRIFLDLFGLPESSVMRCNVLPDFGQGHPDPNLTYAEALVKRLGVFDASTSAPDFGAACDGDADRNMILGRHFFVTPSDSIAIIAANSHCIPYLAKGLAGVSRSMPTSGALDRVAAKLALPIYEVPTGWKFFGNLLDAGLISLCGEESFGTGSFHIREKDGLWAVLCWLSIMAERAEAGKLVSVEEVVRGHWTTYGRNYYQRYDYEGLETAHADQVFKQLESQMQVFIDEASGNTAVNFSYTDPVDKSVSANQGYIFKWADGSRFVFRLSGTGSSGATIRIYLEKFSDDINQPVEEALKAIAARALQASQIHELTGRVKPTVIT